MRTLGARTKVVLRSLLSFVLLGVISGGLTFYFEPLWANDQITRFKLWQQGVQSKYVVVDGYTIHYFEASPAEGAGTPLVLVHGIGARGEAWAPDIAALAAQGFHVYVPDLLGYGRSPQPDVNYAISLQEKIVYDFMDVLKIKTADVGGWSMGGWISLRLALDHPERVRRLVVYDSAGIYFHPEFDGTLFVPSNAEEFSKLRNILSPIRTTLPSFVIRAALDFLRVNGWVIVRSFNAMENGRDLTDFQLQNLHPPTLIVWGSVDQLIPLEVGERMHGQIPNSSLVVVTGCGHLAPAECSKPVMKATVDVLKASQPPAASVTTVDGTVDLARK
jgi:pimeloyl-ACP methyl ester carboxylesterase